MARQTARYITRRATALTAARKTNDPVSASAECDDSGEQDGIFGCAIVGVHPPEPSGQVAVFG